MELRDLGLLDFLVALRLQETIVAGIAAGTSPETLLLVEHPPVYTTGTGGDPGNVLTPGINPCRINRGGDVTWHGPGQLVGYPLVDLRQRGRDVHRYLRFLEEFLIGILAEVAIQAWRKPGQTGVWTDCGKLAAIGIGVRHWITMHGFAVNITNDLTPFLAINPCGIAACPVISAARLSNGKTSVTTLKNAIAGRFQGLLEQMLPVVHDRPGWA